MDRPVTLDRVGCVRNGWRVLLPRDAVKKWTCEGDAEEMVCHLDLGTERDGVADNEFYTRGENICIGLQFYFDVSK